MIGRLLLSLGLILCVGFPLQAQNHALLIGVSEYRDPSARDLNGPRNDVAALGRMLEQRWGKTAVRQLVDAEATKANILKALSQLVDRVKPEDQVFIYFSGHGTSKYDRNFSQNLGLPIAYGSGAFMPHDTVAVGDANSIMSSLLIGQRDLQPLLKRLDRTGANTLVIMDACYSGNSVRSVVPHRNTQPRYQPVRVTDSASFSFSEESTRKPAPPYPYRHIAFLSSASDSEVAQDVNDPSRTLDHKPHGAFSDALLRIFKGQIPADSNQDGRLSNSELRLATTRYLEAGNYSHTPQALPSPEEDAGQLRSRSLFTAAKGDSLSVPQLSQLRVSLDSALSDLQTLVRQEPGLVLNQEQADVRVQASDEHWLLRAGPGDFIGKVAAGDRAGLLMRLRQIAWIKQLETRQQQNPFTLELDLVPGDRGNNFLYGEFLTFRFQLDKKAWLVVLDVDSQGKVVPLYPYQPSEVMGPVDAGKEVYLPHKEPKQSICAQAPEGTDHLIALAFPRKPEFLDRLVGADQLASDHPALLSWKQQLAQTHSPVAVAVTRLRVIAKGGKPCPE